MLNPKLEAFLGCDQAYPEARIVLFGAPLDATTSFRPGTRFAPGAMRKESYGLETYSPYLDKDLSDISAFDAGDLELPFGNPAQALQQIESFTAGILKDNKLPVMLGGEHLATLGVIKAVAGKYQDLHIIHFDAHTDLRDEYYGERLSHATVLRRVWDIVGDGHICQFGIRSGDKSEFLWAKEHVSMCKFNFAELDKSLAALKGKPVYFTLDLDVLDPAVLPGTGTPEAGGVSFMELLDAIKKVSSLNIIGCDVVELCPVYDQSGASTATACKILRELLLSI